MEWISVGLTALISGMSAVFLILILIAFIISRLGQLGGLGKQSEKKGSEEKAPSPKTAAMPKMDSAEEERRILAAITVALAQELGKSPNDFVIRRYRRGQDNRA